MIYISFLDAILVCNPASLRTQLFSHLRLPNTGTIDIHYHLWACILVCACAHIHACPRGSTRVCVHCGTKATFKCYSFGDIFLVFETVAHWSEAIQVGKTGWTVSARNPRLYFLRASIRKLGQHAWLFKNVHSRGQTLIFLLVDWATVPGMNE